MKRHLLKIVAIILLILAVGAVVMPTCMCKSEGHEKVATKVILETMATALNLYQLEVGEYPPQNMGSML